MRANINEQFEKWLREPERFTESEDSLMKAYRDCVINNPDASKYHATMNLTDQFEEILNTLDFYKI